VNEITTLEQLDDVLNATADQPAFILKHSTACPVSFGALRRTKEYLEKSRAAEADLPPFYLIKVIESRPVSNALAQRLGVEHKSPQLILVDQGRAAWHTSHFDINGESIEKALQALAAK
jgi:bacillithiol system protein YtxJ